MMGVKGAKTEGYTCIIFIYTCIICMIHTRVPLSIGHANVYRYWICIITRGNEVYISYIYRLVIHICAARGTRITKRKS